MQYSNAVEHKIKMTAAAVTKHMNLPVIATGLYGSVLRGYSDPNSDVDVCLLVKRPISDYLGVTHNPLFTGTTEERKTRSVALSNTISKEIGINVMIALVDAKDLLTGIMNSNPFSLSAYECFSKDNDYVQGLYAGVVNDYVKTENLIYRTGLTIRKSLTAYGKMLQSGPPNIEYRKERTFLSIYWTAHRLLAYLSGDTKHGRSINELLEHNLANWAAVYPEGFSTQLRGVIKARVERSHFDLPLEIPRDTVNDLFSFTNKVLILANEHLHENHMSSPTSKEQAVEMIELYCQMLDEEDPTEPATA